MVRVSTGPVVFKNDPPIDPPTNQSSVPSTPTHPPTLRTYMGMEGYFSLREAQIKLLAARSAAVSGDSSDLAFTAQFFVGVGWRVCGSSVW